MAPLRPILPDASSKRNEASSSAGVISALCAGLSALEVIALTVQNFPNTRLVDSAVESIHVDVAGGGIWGAITTLTAFRVSDWRCSRRL